MIAASRSPSAPGRMAASGRPAPVCRATAAVVPQARKIEMPARVVRAGQVTPAPELAGHGGKRCRGGHDPQGKCGNYLLAKLSPQSPQAGNG